MRWSMRIEDTVEVPHSFLIGAMDVLQKFVFFGTFLPHSCYLSKKQIEWIDNGVNPYLTVDAVELVFGVDGE